MTEVFFPDDVFKLIMDYCDTRHRDCLKKVLNDLLLVTDIERCENLYEEEMDLLEIRECRWYKEELHDIYDMTEIDPLIQKKLKGLFVRTECLSGFINNTIWAREIYLCDHWDEDSNDPHSINFVAPVKYIWSV